MKLTCAMHLLNAEGVGEKIGTVELRDTPEGLKLTPNLCGLTPGRHGFHIHENSSIEAKNGKPGGAAGQHFDPYKTNRHLGPYGGGHLGDLPVLVVGRDRTARTPVVAPRLKLADVKGKALIIHKHGDNYSDHPTKDGGGCEREAGGLILSGCPYCAKPELRSSPITFDALVAKRWKEAAEGVGFDPDQVDLVWGIGDRYPHFKKARGYAVTFWSGEPPCTILFSSKILAAELPRQDGIVRHEIGHVIDFLVSDPRRLDHWAKKKGVKLPATKLSERRADAIAQAIWGEPIRYDKDLVQSTEVGSLLRPRSLGL